MAALGLIAVGGISLVGLSGGCSLVASLGSLARGLQCGLGSFGLQAVECGLSGCGAWV